MSVSGILSSSIYSGESQSVQNTAQQLRQEFQQLGKDLQSGNLSAAQSDFTTLENLTSQSSSASSSSQSSNPLQQAFNQLGQDLQSGNLSAAQQDFANIQQAIQSQAQQAGQSNGHHHHHGGGGDSQISQLFQQLGQELQSGDLTTAQQTYNSLVQGLQSYSQGTQSSSSSTSASTNTVSITA